MKFKESVEHIMHEMESILNRVEEKKIKGIIDLFFEANSIFVYGAVDIYIAFAR